MVVWFQKLVGHKFKQLIVSSIPQPPTEVMNYNYCIVVSIFMSARCDHFLQSFKAQNFNRGGRQGGCGDGCGKVVRSLFMSARPDHFPLRSFKTSQRWKSGWLCIYSLESRVGRERISSLELLECPLTRATFQTELLNVRCDLAGA